MATISAQYTKIDDVLGMVPGSHKGFGYYRDRLAPSDRSEDYIKYALLIETIFLSSDDSFVCFNRSSENVLEPVYLKIDGEQKRKGLAVDLHKGVVAYSIDFCNEAAKVLPMSFDWISKLATIGSVERLFNLFKKPDWRDASIFSGVVLENYFSGRDVRYIVPPLDNLGAIALWREGVQILKAQNKAEDPVRKEAQTPAHTGRMRQLGCDLAVRAMDLFIVPAGIMVDDRRRRKYLRDKNRFYLDSRHELLRMIWKGSRYSKVMS
uniref:hypothetical protein n=1 Tax=Cupriavidus taiwanensis TaxID=164546 RepID=UPI0011C04D05|nr:hypothetical protein [Cupriavidus taiwanensis]